MTSWDKFVRRLTEVPIEKIVMQTISIKMEYRSGWVQLRRYILFPLIKLSGVMMGATLVLLVWLDIPSGEADLSP